MASSTPLNNDVLIEILLLLPVQSLLRLRAVCKFWRDVIDSPSFQKLHNNNNNNNGDETVYLHFTFLGEGERKLVGPIKGLICIYIDFSLWGSLLPIALCNPSLAQLNVLPNITSFSSNSCYIFRRHVAIGFDGEDYKVVQLVYCYKHRRLHGHLYSGKMNSWRELALDGYQDKEKIEINTIKSSSWSCKNGSFAHWEGFQRVGRIKEGFILSLDVENEVFSTITMPDIASVVDDVPHKTHEILAEDDKDSFLLFVLAPYDVNGESKTMIYESRCEGSGLCWIPMMNVGVSPPPRSHCVAFRTYSDRYRLDRMRKELIVYDYRARKLVGRFELPRRSEVVEYRGSFVSIQKNGWDPLSRGILCPMK